MLPQKSGSREVGKRGKETAGNACALTDGRRKLLLFVAGIQGATGHSTLLRVETQKRRVSQPAQEPDFSVETSREVSFLASLSSGLGDLAGGLKGKWLVIFASDERVQIYTIEKELTSDFSTALMTPTATVCRISRTANRPSGGYWEKVSTHMGLEGVMRTMAASPDLIFLGKSSIFLPDRRSIFSLSSVN